MQRGVPSSILSYGTLGNSLSELGLLSSYYEGQYLPAHLNALEAGKARLTFTLESDAPLGGHVFFWLKGDEGEAGEFRSKALHMRQAGRVQQAYEVFGIEDLFAIRIDIDTLNANFRISEIEIVDQNLDYFKLDKTRDYAALQPNDKLVVNGIDDQGINLSTLAHGDGDSQLLFFTSHFKREQNGFASLFGRKRSPSDVLLRGDHLTTDPADIIEKFDEQGLGVPTLSIRTSDDALNGDFGIITNLEERGREFERLADITYYDVSGKKIFASSVGMRYHGGYNRAKYDSYKFYFRNDYGSTEHAQAQMFPEQVMPIKSFVLHHTQFPEYSPIGHLLAIDAFEAIGIDTPRRQAAMVYLNGEELGFYYITDHLSRRNFNAYFGTEDFRFYRFKSYNPSEDIEALNKDIYPIDSYTSARGEFPEDYIYEHFDVEAITNFMIANTVFNVHDYCQGVLYRRDDMGDPMWRMVGWDFDGAFMKVWEWTVPNWEDSFNIVEEAYTTARDCPYQIIFRKLLRYSADYREYFKDRFEQSLETVFSTEAMQARVEAYRQKFEGKLGVTAQGLDMLDDYFEKRPEFILEQTDRHLAQWEEIARERALRNAE